MKWAACWLSVRGQTPLWKRKSTSLSKGNAEDVLLDLSRMSRFEPQAALMSGAPLLCEIRKGHGGADDGQLPPPTPIPAEKRTDVNETRRGARWGYGLLSSSGERRLTAKGKRNTLKLLETHLQLYCRWLPGPSFQSKTKKNLSPPLNHSTMIEAINTVKPTEHFRIDGCAYLRILLWNLLTFWMVLFSGHHLVASWAWVEERHLQKKMSFATSRPVMGNW